MFCSRATYKFDRAMTALAQFAGGDLAGCLAQLQNDVRRQPAEGKLRVFLAQLLMVTGDWNRALTQLAVAGELDSQALPMLHAYGAAIQCEGLRAQVFAGVRSPLVFGEPLPWIAGLLQAQSSAPQAPTKSRVADAHAGCDRGCRHRWWRSQDGGHQRQARPVE